MMSNISSIVRRFNRFELKYVLSLNAAEGFRRELLAFLQPDAHGDAGGSYAVASLYYDSPDYRCYWEKLEGLRFRRKLRIRHYETPAALTPDTPVFVEIKQRINRVTQKRRVLLPYGDARRLCDARELAEYPPRDQRVVDEIYAMLWEYDLRPTSVVSYARRAYIGTEYDVGLRVTFDTNLRCRAQDLQLHDQQVGRLMTSPDQVVMEVKVNERIPYWLTELIARHNFRLTRISKYCMSVEALARR